MGFSCENLIMNIPDLCVMTFDVSTNQYFGKIKYFDKSIRLLIDAEIISKNSTIKRVKELIKNKSDYDDKVKAYLLSNEDMPSSTFNDSLKDLQLCDIRFVKDGSLQFWYYYGNITSNKRIVVYSDRDNSIISFRICK